MTIALSWLGGELRGTAKRFYRSWSLRWESWILQLRPLGTVVPWRGAGVAGRGLFQGLTVVEGVEEVSGPRDLCPFTTEHQAGGPLTGKRKRVPIFDRQVTLGFS